MRQSGETRWLSETERGDGVVREARERESETGHENGSEIERGA